MPDTPSSSPDTREALLRAAMALFAAEGLGGASTRDIAGRAHTRQSLIRYHFGDKEGLWRAALARARSDVAAVLQSTLGLGSLAPAAGPRARRRVAALVEALAGHRAEARLLLRHAQGEGPDVHAAERLTEPLRRALPPGAALPPDAALALWLWALLAGVALEPRRSGAPDLGRAPERQALSDLLADWWLLLAAPPTAGPWSLAAARRRRLGSTLGEEGTP